MINRIFPQLGRQLSSGFLDDVLSLTGETADATQPNLADGDDYALPFSTETEPSLRSLVGGSVAFIPEHYEENYPYPLLIWLDSNPGDAKKFARRMAGISRRNYIGLQLPIPAFESGRPPCPSRIRDLLQQSLPELRRCWNIHTERIFVAGLDEAAQFAVQLFLSRPDWFAGAVAFSGRFDRRLSIPFRHPELRGKRIFLATAKDDDRALMSAQVATGRTLGAAGLNVVTRLYDGETLSESPVLSDVNAWLIDGLCAAV